MRMLYRTYLYRVPYTVYQSKNQICELKKYTHKVIYFILNFTKMHLKPKIGLYTN